MLAILSPARNIQPTSREGFPPQRPLFLLQAAQLAALLKEYEPWELEGLLELNPQRALDMSACYQMFDPAAPGTPALLSYYGAAFRNMELEDFSPVDLAFAQEHLRVLSAMYGLVRPQDGILPHRLGLGREFRVKGGDLYAYWGRAIYEELFRPGLPVVGLASLDYTRLVSPYLTAGDTLITCRFLVRKRGVARGTVSTVRAARGRMARYLVKNRITEPEELRGFDWAGYQFVDYLSSPTQYVFVTDKI